MLKIALIGTTVALLVAVAPVELMAQTLSISPTKLEVPAPSQQTTIVVKSSGKETSVIQVRVMSWKEGTAPDKLKATRDVAVSPPTTKLRPGEEVTMRVVRVKKRGVRGRECYRVLIDRLPGVPKADEAVRLQVRHSVPLCFTS